MRSQLFRRPEWLLPRLSSTVTDRFVWKGISRLSIQKDAPSGWLVGPPSVFAVVGIPLTSRSAMVPTRLLASAILSSPGNSPHPSQRYSQQNDPRETF